MEDSRHASTQIRSLELLRRENRVRTTFPSVFTFTIHANASIQHHHCDNRSTRVQPQGLLLSRRNVRHVETGYMYPGRAELVCHLVFGTVPEAILRGLAVWYDSKR
jgi:hypothetical protein